MSRLVDPVPSRNRKQDRLVRAERLSSKATNLFEQAKAGLEDANFLLDEEVAEAQAAVASLNDRVKAANERKAANDKVIAKFADFVVVN